MTILPSRFIFSLDALPKIIESILSLELNNCMQEDYALNGDPHQMAYEPNRGTTSCNAITYTHVDLNLSKGHTCIQLFVDVRKAFNVMCRPTMLKCMQKIAEKRHDCGSRIASSDLHTVKSDLHENNKKLFLHTPRTFLTCPKPSPT